MHTRSAQPPCREDRTGPAQQTAAPSKHGALAATPPPPALLPPPLQCEHHCCGRPAHTAHKLIQCKHPALIQCKHPALCIGRAHLHRQPVILSHGAQGGHPAVRRHSRQLGGPVVMEGIRLSWGAPGPRSACRYEATQQQHGRQAGHARQTCRCGRQAWQPGQSQLAHPASNALTTKPRRLRLTCCAARGRRATRPRRTSAATVLHAVLHLRHQRLAGAHEPLGAALQCLGRLVPQIMHHLLGPRWLLLVAARVQHPAPAATAGGASGAARAAAGTAAARAAQAVC